MKAAGDHVRPSVVLVLSVESSVKLKGASGFVVITAPLFSPETSEFP